MNHQELLASLQGRGLFAWQATFIASFLETDSTPFHLLTAPPGTGKTYASVAIAAELVARRAKRMLALPPASLCEEWSERLRDAQSEIPVLLVTRQVFREMEAALPIGQSPWNAENIYVISQDLAKQSDLAKGLSAAEWDLVIVDEAHRFAAPQRAALLNKLISSDLVRRLLLLSATPLPALEPWLRPSPDQQVQFRAPLVVTNWYGELKNWDGSTVERPRVELSVFSYTRNADEVRCLLRFLGSKKDLETASDGNQFLIQLLTQRASSSLFAFEQSLQRLGHTLRSAIEGDSVLPAKASTVLPEMSSTSEEVGSTVEERRCEWIDKPAGLAIVDQCLSELEMISTDEKLNALRRLIRLIVDAECNGNPKICVISMYADTVLYLHTAIDDCGLPLFKMTGASSYTERQDTVELFLHEGGLILSTDGALKGIKMPQVPHVVYYDLPSNPLALEYRQGRFNRFGRNSPLTMYAFRDESGVLPLESQLIDKSTGIGETGIDGMSSTTEP